MKLIMTNVATAPVICCIFMVLLCRPACAQSTTPYVANNTALQALATTSTPVVWRLGFTTEGDAPPLLYSAGTSACSLGTSGAGDNGSQVKSGDGKCWLAVFDAANLDVREWGAKCNGMISSDDEPAIDAALAYVASPPSGSLGSGTVLIPDAICNVQETVHIYVGSNLRGAAFAPQDQPAGSIIQCVATLDPCVQMDASTVGTNYGGQKLENLTINSAATSDSGIGANSTCFQDNSFKTTIRDVLCSGFANGFYFYDTNVHGLDAHLDHAWTCDIIGSDIVQDGFPELHVTHGRFGCNATARGTRTAHANYILITNTSSTSGGANTLTVEDSQFNDKPGANCWINWAAYSYVPNAGEYKFTDNHWEATNPAPPPTPPQNALFCSDSTVTVIHDVLLANNQFQDNNSASTSLVWVLNAATTIEQWTEVGNHWAGFNATGWTLAPTAPVYNLASSGEVFNTPFSIAGPSGATKNMDVTFGGDIFANGVAVSGSFGIYIPKISGVLQAGSVSNSATTPVEIDIPGNSAFTASTLGLTFGGLAATLTSTALKWQLNGSLVSVLFNFTISSLGSGSGTAVLTGLPFAAATINSSAVSAIHCTGLSGMSGAPILFANAGAAAATFYQTNSTGVSAMTNSNFTTSTFCSGGVTYSLQ